MVFAWEKIILVIELLKYRMASLIWISEQQIIFLHKCVAYNICVASTYTELHKMFLNTHEKVCIWNLPLTGCPLFSFAKSSNLNHKKEALCLKKNTWIFKIILPMEERKHMSASPRNHWSPVSENYNGVGKQELIKTF